jgi:hypothetical protein
MHVAIRALFSPIVYFMAKAVNSWASKLKPHELAFQNFGIRIVAEQEDGTWDNHEEAYAALILLSEHEEGALELVKKHIRTIYFFEPWQRENGYGRSGKICILDIRKFANYAPGTIPISIAGLLVYFATLTELEISRSKKNAVRKKVANEEEDRVVTKLQKILCE